MLTYFVEFILTMVCYLSVSEIGERYRQTWDRHIETAADKAHVCRQKKCSFYSSSMQRHLKSGGSKEGVARWEKSRKTKVLTCVSSYRRATTTRRIESVLFLAARKRHPFHFLPIISPRVLESLSVTLQLPQASQGVNIFFFHVCTLATPSWLFITRQVHFVSFLRHVVYSAHVVCDLDP